MTKSIGSKVTETEPAQGFFHGLGSCMFLTLVLFLSGFAGWKYYTRPYKVGDVIHHKLSQTRAIIVAPGKTEGQWNLRMQSDMQKISLDWPMDEWERD